MTPFPPLDLNKSAFRRHGFACRRACRLQEREGMGLVRRGEKQFIPGGIKAGPVRNTEPSGKLQGNFINLPGKSWEKDNDSKGVHYQDH